ncbi:hypothetical protein Rhow_000834 [Rhodococcus wratislaviensis]|uniref:Uncharacterized protein n=1 Tax=Rhodococcus wratislaviensis TaxID=44752 RepID=A0A402C2T5_RHOWR|nr:hypothetical protein Rhow_000834 [Rhodococcus wratislaviensis]
MCAHRLFDLLAAPETWHQNAAIDRLAPAITIASGMSAHWTVAGTGRRVPPTDGGKP